MFSAKIKRVSLFGIIRLGTTPMFITETFILEELKGGCVYLLERTKIETLYWHHFYKVKDEFYVLFLKTYSVTYPKHPGVSNSIFLFRFADLIELSFVSLKLAFHQGKIFLDNRETPFAIGPSKKPTLDYSNVCDFENDFLPETCKIIFSSEKNDYKQFMLLLGKKELENRVGIPKLEKLKQFDRSAYLVKHKFHENLTVELPIYLFRKRLEIFGLVVPIKFIVEKTNKPAKVTILFMTYNFNINQNIFCVDTVRNYCIHFNYTIKNCSINFKISKIVDSNTKKELGLEEIKLTNLFEATGKRDVLKFIGGAIIYDQRNAVTLTCYRVYTDKQRTEFDGSEKNYILIFLGLLLLLTCFSFYVLLFSFKTKICKKRKFTRIRKK